MLTVKKDIYLIIQSFHTVEFKCFHFVLQQFENYKHFNHTLCQFPFETFILDPSPIIGYACH